MNFIHKAKKVKKNPCKSRMGDGHGGIMEILWNKLNLVDKTT